MTDSVNIRELSLDCLMEILEKQQYSHLVLRMVLEKYQYLSKQERAFLTRLTEGTLERMIELDYIINAFSKTKVRKMKPLIRNLLRMSVYQLKYMDSIPDSAVCNEAVKLAKKRGFSQLSGFVNGVLRNIARSEDPVEKMEKEKDPVTSLEVRYSVPGWMIEVWTKCYGSEKTESILKAFQEEKPIAIRTNLTKCSPEQLSQRLQEEGVWKVEPMEELSYGFYISGVDYLNRLESFVDGWFYVQDKSSMMVAEIAGAKPGDTVIDVCAAPGGKSCHIAQKVGATGQVIARDLTEYKVGLMEENRIRYGLDNMIVEQQDATEFDKASEEKADILICDLPCSGLGVIGRKKEIRYRMNPKQQKELVQLQRKILETVHTYVKRGGTLLYCTCTIHPDENEGNVSWFLEQYPEFFLESMQQRLPDEGVQDGFFIAKFIRKE